MSEAKQPNIKKLQRRANLPKYLRAAAISAFVIAVIGIGISFYVYNGKAEFRLKPEHTQLSTNVLAEVSNYERTESEGELKKYYIKADHAKTFTDNHQELEGVYLEVYDDQGVNFDKITADRALYVPEENKNFTGYFAGSVNIETRDALKVKTEQITYTRAKDTAEIEDAVEFERENVKGKSIGAIVHIAEKRLELMKNVEISTYATGADNDITENKIQSAKIQSNYAMFDQANQKIEFSDNVNINIIPNGDNAKLTQPTDIKANRATANFENRQIKQIDLTGNVDVYQRPSANSAGWTHTQADKATAKIEREIKRLELFDNVQIETTLDQSKPTKINSGYALYEKDADKFTLRNGVRILTVEDSQPTNIQSAEAVYEQANGKILLTGAAQITQNNDLLKGSVMTAELFPNKKLKFADAKGGAYLKQTSDGRLNEISADYLSVSYGENNNLQTAKADGGAHLKQSSDERITDLSANQLNVSYGANNALTNANAIGNSNVIITPLNSKEYTKLAISAPTAIHLNFKGAGLLDQMQTDGRTTILMNAPNNAPDAANKKIVADSVKTVFQADGKSLARADANGNAELYVEPLNASAQNYKTTINAAQFTCEFYPTGNNAKNCVALTKTKTVRVPTVPTETRGTQTLLADRLNTIFNQQNQDIQQFDASGETKFTELDRHAVADSINFSADEQIIRLRGGEPTVWDSRARAKAQEIDWNTQTGKTNLRGGVSTTYYSQKTTGGATPFSATNAPVYITADNAELMSKEQTGLYTGNARAWQDNNYVRADRLFLQQTQGQLNADGKVQSVLYNAKQKQNGKESNVPVFAQAEKLSYNRENRILRYQENVDIRQGTDRITAGQADVYMDDKNDLSQTIAERNVVITQPNRRAAGEFAQYTAASEQVLLRGNPASVEDSENGSTKGAQITVFMREKRFVSENKPSVGQTVKDGRIRTVYKIKKQ